MNRVIIACEVFRHELEHLAQSMENPPLIKFQKQGLHDTPEVLRESLQKLIEEVEEEHSPEYISLAYGLCGRGIADVRTKKAILIVPRTHDCIPLIMGTGPEHGPRSEEFLSTYWGSVGWVQYSQLDFIIEREKRYKKYVEDYGQDSADYLMETEQSWKAHYTNYKMIKWDETFSEKLRDDGKYIAEDMKLPYDEVQGKSWYLKELIEGGQNTDHFFHVKNGETVDLDADGNISVRPLA